MLLNSAVGGFNEQIDLGKKKKKNHHPVCYFFSSLLLSRTTASLQLYFPFWYVKAFP